TNIISNICPTSIHISISLRQKYLTPKFQVIHICAILLIYKLHHSKIPLRGNNILFRFTSYFLRRYQFMNHLLKKAKNDEIYVSNLLFLNALLF
ncbi:hypothetical protein X975_21641, partial [Stegodyphus mimosarum]